jgi:hypothetical protein
MAEKKQDEALELSLPLSLSFTLCPSQGSLDDWFIPTYLPQ